jgi:tRNA modification GTPase
VLGAALEAGASPAGPGEFTRRAFLNGKLTLTEAEAVGLLIDADTESRRTLAAAAAEGRLSAALAPVTESLTDVLAALYAAIDYPEEDVGDEGERAFAGTMEGALARIRALRATFRCGSAVASGLPTVIAGVPNSGKSSLYNLLLGREDAIVTEIPGTTRDVLSAAADFGGVTLLLSDTAGIRESADAVERIGVERARRKLEDAALILFVVDASVPLTAECARLYRAMPAGVPVVTVLNKADRGCALDEEECASFSPAVRLSARTGEGREALYAAVAAAAGADAVDCSRDAVIWDARQDALLGRAEGLLACAREALRRGDPLDAVCTMCESAAAELSGVDGRGVDEAIIEGIFSRFCVGK